MTNEERHQRVKAIVDEIMEDDRLYYEILNEIGERRKNRLKARADEILLERFIPLKLSAQYDETPVLTLGEYPEWLQ